MTLLHVSTYDPAVAVAKATSASLAMTALDSTNLRATFTAPPSGRVLVRIRGNIHGSGTVPQILFGLLDQAGAVVTRVAPTGLPTWYSGSATTFFVAESVFVVNVPPTASITWDAAYGVETAVSGTALKYGGPNDVTGNNAFGAFIFEVWAA